MRAWCFCFWVVLGGEGDEALQPCRGGRASEQMDWGRERVSEKSGTLHRPRSACHAYIFSLNA